MNREAGMAWGPVIVGSGKKPRCGRDVADHRGSAGRCVGPGAQIGTGIEKVERFSRLFPGPMVALSGHMAAKALLGEDGA